MPEKADWKSVKGKKAKEKSSAISLPPGRIFCLNMSDGEIRQAYRLAADKKQQIKILAQLNAMSVRAVEEIVGV